MSVAFLGATGWTEYMLGEYQSSRTMRTREVGFPCSSVGKESACSAGNPGSIPGWEDPLEKEMATHSSILAQKISWTKDRGAWWAAVHWVTKSRARLSD